MSTATTSSSPDIGPSPDQHATVLRNVRNIAKINMRRLLRGIVGPKRTETNPSPTKASAGSRVPGSSQTRANVDTAIVKELSDGQYDSEDLAEHMFGHLVSTELARDILRRFVNSGYVAVKKKTGASESNDLQHALDEAFEDTIEHGLRSLDSQQPTTKKQKTKYSWEWNQFPPSPIKEDPMVEFLNLVIQRAFHFAETSSRLVAPNDHLLHRFAAPPDKNHALPLSYEADGEDMRPDVLLLPLKAFQEDSQTVDEQYVNFTAVRAVGESKTEALSNGVNQVQRYLRAVRRSQPWIHFATAIVITKERFCLMRGDSSGTERVQLRLFEGRGCIEFIRILLGLALANPSDLGQNPDVELASAIRPCRLASRVRNAPSIPLPPAALPRASASLPPGNSLGVQTGVAANDVQSAATPSTPATHSTGAETSQQSTNAKRGRLQTDDEVDPPEPPAKQSKVGRVNRKVFFLTRLYEHVCRGLLYSASSIRGRCTVVFCVANPADSDHLLALKMSWQDAARLDDQEQVLEKLSEGDGHPNVVVSRNNLRALRQGKICSTLQAIRGFLDDQLAGFGVENRLLIVSLSDLKRPVKYFWGLHDFVRGLRGALLGHQYLVSIGILHRDFSENNMVLGLFPGDERGYLIDPDMAIMQEAARPTHPELPSTSGGTPLISFSGTVQHDPLLKQDDSTPVKGLRTGTTPYMSFNVLRGGKHTQFDDVESFLYVLLLFFFSYAGPLDKKDLLDAHNRGFVESVGDGRLPHMMSWPSLYAEWIDGDFEMISDRKYAAVARVEAGVTLVTSRAWQDCLKHWPSELHAAINTLLGNVMNLFSQSMLSHGRLLRHTEVSHDQFLALLDAWLEAYAGLEHDFSNCPFPSDLSSSQPASVGV